MKIYTKTGDTGQSSLVSGHRVMKDAQRLQAYGAVDELNSCLGVLRAQLNAINFSDPGVDPFLEKIQNQLFNLGSQLACDDLQMAAKLPQISAALSQELEFEIDRMELQLTPLKNFILPGGTLAAAQAHVARTIARRSEREIVSLHATETVQFEILQYVNRLSDYLFVLARFLNHRSGFPDQAWKK